MTHKVPLHAAWPASLASTHTSLLLVLCISKVLLPPAALCPCFSLSTWSMPFHHLDLQSSPAQENFPWLPLAKIPQVQTLFLLRSTAVLSLFMGWPNQSLSSSLDCQPNEDRTPTMESPVNKGMTVYCTKSFWGHTYLYDIIYNLLLRISDQSWKMLRQFSGPLQWELTLFWEAHSDI